MIKEQYLKTFLHYHDYMRYEILIRVIENVINNSLFTQRDDEQKVSELFSIMESFNKSKELRPIYIVQPRSNKVPSSTYIKR